MPGCSSRNRVSSCGTKYLAVLTMPTVSRPDSSLRSRAIASSASFSVASKPLGVDQEVLAGGGQRDLAPLAVEEGQLDRRFQAPLICIVTAGG